MNHYWGFDFKRIESDVVDIEFVKTLGESHTLEQKNSRMENDCKFMTGDSKVIQETIQINPDVFDPLIIKDIKKHLQAVDDYTKEVFTPDEKSREFARSDIEHFTKILLEQLSMSSD